MKIILCWKAAVLSLSLTRLIPSASAFSISSLMNNYYLMNDNVRSASATLRVAPSLSCSKNNHSHSNRNDSSANLISTLCLSTIFGYIVTIGNPLPASAALPTSPDETQGLEVVTKSELGKSVRGSIIRGAQLADSIDLKWERFSDSLRDEAKCDPVTNRRMFDNGFRRDGTRIGNPVLGALCTPEPLKDLDTSMSTLVVDLGREATSNVLNIDKAAILKKESEVLDLVGPAFQRAAKTSTQSSLAERGSNEDIEVIKRQTFNRDLYVESRAFGELVPDTKAKREIARAIERKWGDKLLTTLAPNAGRQDYNSPFPKPDPANEQPYDEAALLDALGKVSVALMKLQMSGIVGHWEISIPEDDDWNVVTIAIDDDISIGGQILGRERNQPLSGSVAVAMVLSAMETEAKIPYKMDTFFIDPTTTRQELYNPTQLLISLSDLGQ